MVTSYSIGAVTRANLSQPSWSGFRLDNIMRPLIAFSVARSSVFNMPVQSIHYDKVLMNVGGGWSALNDSFIAPLRGIYFFSWSCGVTKNNYTHLLLRLNGYRLYSAAASVSSVIPSFNSYDFLTRTAMLSLNVSDTVDTIIYDAFIYSDPGHLLIDFHGFYYCPMNGVQVSVHALDL